MSSTSGQVEAGWRVVVHTCGVGFLIAEGPRVIAAVEDSSVDGARVSNLIAAAPDMFAEIARQHDELRRELDGPIPVSERDRDRYVRLGKLLGLSEGRK